MEPEYSPEDLQKLIDYHFSDPDILSRALTRRSYLEMKQCTLEEKEDNMAPLATLGDAVLDLMTIYNLYDKKGLRKIGDLTKLKIKNIKKEKIRAIAAKHSYEKYVRWGRGEEESKIWNIKPKTFDTCIEALIGAIYLDAASKGKEDLIYFDATSKGRKDPISTVEDVLSKLGFALES